jgi:hypothetical protein
MTGYFSRDIHTAFRLIGPDVLSTKEQQHGSNHGTHPHPSLTHHLPQLMDDNEICRWRHRKMPVTEASDLPG